MINTYLVLKLLHIVSSTLLFGTGLGSAWYMWRAHRGGSLDTIVHVSRNVVLADWLFTTPAIIIQPLTGIGMMHLLGYSFTLPWILWSLLLYGLAGACWLPVVWLQLQVHGMSRRALHTGSALPPAYHRYMRYWFLLGWPAFFAVVAIFALMVFKPA
jgi:uncharacterized membrane protein